jgi:hypothetical protein
LLLLLFLLLILLSTEDDLSNETMKNSESTEGKNDDDDCYSVSSWKMFSYWQQTRLKKAENITRASCGESELPQEAQQKK